MWMELLTTGQTDKAHPIRLTVNNTDIKRKIIKSAEMLKSDDEQVNTYKNVTTTPAYTRCPRQQNKTMKQEMARRGMAGEK